MKILFLHFPIDNEQIESKTLPDYFAEMGHETYSVFEKGERRFTSKHMGRNLPVCPTAKELIGEIDFDLIVCKNNSVQSYGRKFVGNNTKIFNITPMGMEENYRNCHHYFREDELIKAPVPEMQRVYDQHFLEWSQRKKQVLVPASIGTDKNQKEIVDFVDASFKDYTFVFAGPIHNQDYAKYLSKTLAGKEIESSFVFCSREELAHLYSESRLVMLTTDPRPHQPYDPGPRVIFEAVRAGTVCLINDLVLVNEMCKPYCFVYNNARLESFQEAWKAYEQTNMDEMSKNAYEDGKKFLTIEYACKVAYERILSVC